MKIDYDSFKVKKSDCVDTMKFGIENEAIIFDILSTKLYKNPLKILIQEYMSNARDSHREALKSEIPIDVILPTPIDPYIRFIDYGIGLSSDRIAKVFVKLGNSTKSTNNNETGGFGIGAKTAWSYTDSFNITTVYNKIEYKYIAYLDNNIGKLDLLSKKEVDKCNGTIIKVNINSKDLSKAAKCVFRTSFFWKVRPNIIDNNNTFSFEDYTIKYIQNKSAAIVDTSRYEGYLKEDNNDVIIVIDGIIYDSVNNYIPHNKINTKYRMAVYLFFNTGELFPVINREAIFNDNNTHDVLNSKIDIICKKISKSIDISDVEYIKDLYNIIKEKDLELFYFLTKFQISNNFFSIYYSNTNFYIDLRDYGYILTQYKINRIHNRLNAINYSNSMYISKPLMVDVIIINDKFTKIINKSKIKQFCNSNNIENVTIITASIDTKRRKTKEILQLFKSLSTLENVYSYSDMFAKTTTVSNRSNYYYEYQSYSKKVELKYCNQIDLQNNYTHYILYKGRKDDIGNYVELTNIYNYLTEDTIIILKYNKYQPEILDGKEILSLEDLTNLFQQHLIDNINQINFYYYCNNNVGCRSNDIDYVNRLKKIYNLKEYFELIEDNKFKKFILDYDSYYLKINDKNILDYNAHMYNFFRLFRRISRKKINEVEIKQNFIKRKIKKFSKGIDIFFIKYPLLDYIKYYTNSDDEIYNFVDYINIYNEAKKENV